MQLLSKSALLASLASSEANSLFIEPLLDENQVGQVTIDLRLGYDFQVGLLTRKPSIAPGNRDGNRRSIDSFFEETRRDLGDRFVLYPNQTVVATTLEYVALPTDVFADILTRSSYNRLGVTINTMVQPGWRGSIPLELFNHGNVPIELVVGSRFAQARFFQADEGTSYLDANRKYHADVRPALSGADKDEDLDFLLKVVKKRAQLK